MVTEMLTKEKRVQVIFLFFLITFTHGSFPLPWGTIGKKTCSYSVKSFQYIEKFLGTKTGSIVGQMLILVCSAYVMRYAIKKAIKKFFDEFGKLNDELKKLNKGSEINRYKKKEGEKGLKFEDSYVGDPPPEIRTLMNDISYPKTYSEFGVNPKKGILICGPAGVGKTWLAEILADEVDAEMFIVNGSYLKGGGLRGSGSKRVRKVFSKARNTKKHAIILIDEFDAISCISFSGEEDVEALKTFLTEMEGFDTKINDKITVIGLTNNPCKLSPALLRRFNTTQIDLPDEKAREELLEFYVKKHMSFKKSQECCILKNVKLGVLAQQSSTGGFSHDNLKSVVTHVFTQVAELKNGFRQNKDSHGLILDKEKIEIQHEAFKVAVQNFKNQIKYGSKNFLVKSNDQIPEHILHSIYS